ncbi:MAG: glycosyltransferase [Sterolibacteriaceae bacterium]|nr:glycosyltransferase [Sterolibacteriaceae bacterium]MBK9085403.1 glycosyltransferase [Sterolibacteriaceae bacterium]
MKVLMVSDVALPRVNGVSTAIATYRNRLDSYGIETRLIAPRYGDEPQEASTTRLPGWRLPFDPEDRLVPPLRMRRAVCEAASNADLIHIQTPFSAHYAAIAAARRFKLPVVATYHTLFEEYLHLYAHALPERATRALARAVSRAQCNALSATIVPSSAMAQRLRDYRITTPLHVLPTGVPLMHFTVVDRAASRARFRARHGIPNDNPLALFVGRVAHEKNLEFLIEALGHAHGVVPELMLLIAGDGPAADRLREIARASGRTDRIRFLGYLDREAGLPECYAAADLFAFASRTETQGLVLVEAMAVGLPVVALAEMGTRDLLATGHGALVPPDNVAAFGAAMARLATDHALRERLGEEAKALAREWSDLTLTSRLATLYREIESSHRRAFQRQVSWS